MKILSKTLAQARERESKVVFDPFVGSGTSCLAAKHLGLNYIGFEINEKYYKIAIDRLNGWNQKGELNLLEVNYEEDDE